MKTHALIIAAAMVISPVVAFGQNAPQGQGGGQSGQNGAGQEANSAGGAQQPAQQQQPAPPPPQNFDQAYAQSGGSLNTMEDPPAAPSVNGAPQRTNTSLFAVLPKQPKKIQKYDLLTVIIREESDSKSAGTSDLKKNSDFNALLQQYVKLSLDQFTVKGQAPLTNAPQVQMQGSRNFKGEATVDRSDSMSARVQAQVIDVKPNGILIIQATKMIKSDAEEQKFVLTGMVRAEDLTPDNSVLSTQLADLMLEKTTKGQASDTTRRGAIPWLFDKLNPF